MATGTIPSTTLPPPPPAPLESAEYERIIQRQLRRASLHVRLVDLASGLAVWAIGVLALFLLAALVDHVVGLGIGGRFLALAVLLGGTIYYLAMRVAPLLVHSINPTYAARTIEEATPSLKNSLINFLLLRQDRIGIKEIVFQAVERKAAADIVTVPVESTIDRSRLIHAGYALCGVMALFAAYKILSPKDPFQTVARVLAPWADIARPSRVQITDVQPGNSEVYHGQTVKVSANIRGIGDGQPVTLRYSTADGQTANRPVAMMHTVGGRYECMLPPQSGRGESPLADFSTGIQQNVVYRIVAGDAETTSFRLTAIDAPTIIVERVEYQFPSYTKLPPQTQLQQGDIKALEGTKATIHAVANQPVKLARIEFDADAKDGSPETMPLHADGTRAWGTTALQLKNERRAAWHSTYQVRFYNERGQPSQQPILHRIEVIRDMPPELQIVRPERVRIEVPEDGEIRIEVRAVDPDFGLANVRLEGAAAGKAPLKIELLGSDANQPAQANVPYDLRPREHGLAAGDELKYIAVTEDNRASPLTGQPEPNVTRTPEYTLVVTQPLARDAGQGQPVTSTPSGAGQNKAKGNPPADQQKAKQGPRQPGPNERPPQPGDQGQPQPMNSGAGGQQEVQGTPPQPGDQQQNQQQKGGSQQDQKQKGQKGGQQQGSKSGQPQGQSQQGEPQGSGAEGANSGASAQPTNPMAGGTPGASSNAGQAGGKSADSQPTPGQSGESPPNSSGQPSGTGRRQDKAHEGEAIEQVFKELQKEKEGEPGKEGEAPAAAGTQPPQPGATQPKGAESPKGAAGEPQPTPGEDQSGAGQPMSKASGQDQKGKGKQGEGQQAEGQAPTPGAEPEPQPQAAGQSGAQGQKAQKGGKPGPNDQKLEPMGQGQEEQGAKGEPQDRLPDEKQGQNSAQQKGSGSKGGAPQGPSKTNQDKQSSKGGGEKHDAGAAKQGEEGAGAASKEKGGSAEGTKANRDKKKEPMAESGKAQEGEPSPPSESKKQSDSKGGQSGDQSGGGKKGSGQSAGQEGNDSAGSKSAADQGAGTAGETGSGETGSKAGSEQEAAGKTGQSGQKKGEGSGTKADEEGTTPSSSGKPQKGSPPGKAPQKGEKGSHSPEAGGKRGGSGAPIEGGGEDERERAEGTPPAEVAAADAANLEYARKATEMVLKRLKDEEHNPGPELLDKLGWTKEDLVEFLRRWDALQKSAQETRDGQRELDEALKSLGLRDPGYKKRAGGAIGDTQRDLRDAGNRSSPPPKYRDLFDSFRKGAARSRE